MKSRLLLVLFCSFSMLLSAQEFDSSAHYVSHYVHVKPPVSRNYKEIVFFVLEGKADGKVVWTSPRLKPIDVDQQGYVVKVDVPDSLAQKITTFDCTAEMKADNIKSGGGDGTWGSTDDDPVDEFDMLESVAYGGIALSKIRLKITSDPIGAEVYLIPNRIWQMNIQHQDWRNDEDILLNYRVNTSLTETYAFIDETVYTVVFSLNGKHKVLRHFTKPQAVEAEQQIAVQFEE